MNPYFMIGRKERYVELHGIDSDEFVPCCSVCDYRLDKLKDGNHKCKKNGCDING